MTVEPYWAGLFAQCLAKKSMDDIITNVGSGGPAPLPVVLPPVEVRSCSRRTPPVFTNPP